MISNETKKRIEHRIRVETAKELYERECAKAMHGIEMHYYDYWWQKGQFDECFSPDALTDLVVIVNHVRGTNYTVKDYVISQWHCDEEYYDDFVQMLENKKAEDEPSEEDEQFSTIKDIQREVEIWEMHE